MAEGERQGQIQDFGYEGGGLIQVNVITKMQHIWAQACIFFFALYGVSWSTGKRGPDPQAPPGSTPCEEGGVVL